MSKPNILFFADTTHQAGAVLDHIHAVTASNEFEWHIVNPLILKTSEKLDFSLFDAVGVHFSIKLHGYYYLSSALKKKIRAYSGPKFVFLQDEYQRVNQMQGLLYFLKFDVLFTLVAPELVNQAYPDSRLKALKKVHILTGYVDDAMHSFEAPPIASRPLDVSYRVRRYDYRLGKLAQEKVLLASEFMNYAAHTDLSVDISMKESDRVYGDAWFDLLMRSKVVLGTESGASIWDRDGQVSKKVKQFLRKHKGASFETVFEAVLKPYEGNLLYAAISPRIFEAAAAKTAMVMFTGHYSGLCQPNVHYIALEKDFSNISDVLEKIQDTAYLQAMVDRTYADLIASGNYARSKLTDLISQELKLMTAHKPATASVEAIRKQYDKVILKYHVLNKIRRFYTEFIFVVCNFLQILFFEPSSAHSSKRKFLFEGAKRYIAYLSLRIKKNQA
ncbi:MAG: hypothetical protein P1U61_00720 [Legionellaceae bacterium]|nr:hypothetical protein [Legionellaceae bacterium]